MILVVTGSRHANDPAVLEAAMAFFQSEWVGGFATGLVIYHGGATGIDALADEWARRHRINPKPFPVTPEEWFLFGKGAGPRRNQRMLSAAVASASKDRPYLMSVGVAVLAVPCPKSRGTWDCVRKAKAMGIPVHVYRGLLG